MAFALYVKTESSDSHVYAFDGEPTQEEIITRLRASMGDEFYWIAECDYDSTYSIDFDLPWSKIEEERDNF